MNLHFQETILQMLFNVEMSPYKLHNGYDHQVSFIQAIDSCITKTTFPLLFSNVFHSPFRNPLRTSIHEMWI